MNDTQRLDKLEIDLRRLKALVYKQLFGANAGPVSIDFAVDIFDRADADSLGTYWSPLDFAWNSFVIRNKRAVALGSNQNSNAEETFRANFFPPLSSVWGETVHAISKIPQGMVYQPKMTSGDFTVKVAFDGPPVPVLSSSFDFGGGLINYQYDGVACGFGAVAVSVTSLGLGQGVGSFGYSGFWGNAFKTPAQLVNSIVPTSAFYGAPLFGETGATKLLTASSVQIAADYNQLSAFNITDTNLLVMTFSGSNVKAVLNGTTLMDASSLLTVTRSKAGILAGVSSLLFWLSAFSLAPVGITKFKVWRNDIPEPPDAQSGHGTYAAGNPIHWQYSDVYHTPVFDANGTLTGYNYVRT